MRGRTLVAAIGTGVAGAIGLAVAADDVQLPIKRHLRTSITVVKILNDYNSLKPPTLALLEESNKLELLNQDSKPTSARILPAGIPPVVKDATRDEAHQRCADRLLKLFQVNGGVYIKIGQHISSLVYLVPKEYTSTMSVLQDNCPVTPLESVMKVIEEETNEVFTDFDPVPIGCASLAQVHTALYKGNKVAIKVQHDYLDSHAKVDIVTCSLMAKLVKKVFPAFEFGWLAEEMERNLPLELDFVHEHANTERARRNFKGEDGLIIPKVYLSTRRLLVMEYIEGGKVDDTNYIQRNMIDPQLVSIQLGRVYGEMIFNHRFVHCDPHQGNLLLLPRNLNWFQRLYRKQNFDLVLLDHGLYRDLDKTFVNDYAHFWFALIKGNDSMMEQYAFRIFQHDKREQGDIQYWRMFSSIVSGRSWEALTDKSGGITTLRSKAEMDLVQNKAAKSEFLEAITLVLSKCPRELLLVLKTNDLMRSVDRGLGLDERGSIGLIRQLGWDCVKCVWRNEGFSQWKECSQMTILLSFLRIYEFFI